MAFWQIDRLESDHKRVRIRLRSPEGAILSFGEVIDKWAIEGAEGNPFRLFFSLMVASSTFSALRFETPAVTKTTMNQAFEFVMLNAPSLDRDQDGSAFRSQFEQPALGDEADGRFAVFPNLGKNATLIVPVPANAQGVNHCHLVSYLRTADQGDGMEMWRQVGIAMQNRISDTPVWLSTAGGGVPWLHIRLDDRPKYYAYEPYREFPYRG